MRGRLYGALQNQRIETHALVRVTNIHTPHTHLPAIISSHKHTEPWNSRISTLLHTHHTQQILLTLTLVTHIDSLAPPPLTPEAHTRWASLRKARQHRPLPLFTRRTAPGASPLATHAATSAPHKPVDSYDPSPREPSYSARTRQAHHQRRRGPARR